MVLCVCMRVCSNLFVCFPQMLTYPSHSCSSVINYLRVPVFPCVILCSSLQRVGTVMFKNVQGRDSRCSLEKLPAATERSHYAEFMLYLCLYVGI
jgi:hypothetical protein